MIGVLIEMPEPGWWIWCWGNLNPSELITLIGLRVSYFSCFYQNHHGPWYSSWPRPLGSAPLGKNESKRFFGTHLQLILERKKIVSHLGTLREATKICFPGKQTKMWKIRVSLLIFIYHIYTHELHIHRLYASITYIFTYLHIYTYTYWHIYILTYIHIYIYTYIHIYIYTYIHIYTCIHVYMYTYIHTYIHTYICSYMYMYIHVYIYT